MSWSGKFEGSSEKRAAKPNHKDGGTYCPQFKASDAKFELALHHITDWALLRGVWNRMVDDKHWATICAWLYSVGFDVSNIYYETGAAQTPALITRTLMLGGVIDESVADSDEIHQRITWSTWNLVEGPKESARTDDRGNFHDVFSTVKAGISDLERADLRLADNVYTIMSGLNLKQPVLPDRAQSLTRALLAVHRNAPIIKLRPEMWVNDGSGKVKCWRKNI